jgi:hypothetical protein
VRDAGACLVVGASVGLLVGVGQHWLIAQGQQPCNSFGECISPYFTFWLGASATALIFGTVVLGVLGVGRPWAVAPLGSLASLAAVQAVRVAVIDLEPPHWAALTLGCSLGFIAASFIAGRGHPWWVRLVALLLVGLCWGLPSWLASDTSARTADRELATADSPMFAPTETPGLELVSVAIYEGNLRLAYAPDVSNSTTRFPSLSLSVLDRAEEFRPPEQCAVAPTGLVGAPEEWVLSPCTGRWSDAWVTGSDWSTQIVIEPATYPEYLVVISAHDLRPADARTAVRSVKEVTSEDLLAQLEAAQQN